MVSLQCLEHSKLRCKSVHKILLDGAWTSQASETTHNKCITMLHHIHIASALCYTCLLLLCCDNGWS